MQFPINPTGNRRAEVIVRRGFERCDYYVLMRGNLPHANTTVMLSPVIYVHQPEWHLIQVMEVTGGDEILLPAIGDFFHCQEVSQYAGKKGWEFAFFDESIRIELPQ